MRYYLYLLLEWNSIFSPWVSFFYLGASRMLSLPHAWWQSTKYIEISSTYQATPEDRSFVLERRLVKLVTGHQYEDDHRIAAYTLTSISWISWCSYDGQTVVTKRSIMKITLSLTAETRKKKRETFITEIWIDNHIYIKRNNVQKTLASNIEMGSTYQPTPEGLSFVPRRRLIITNSRGTPLINIKTNIELLLTLQPRFLWCSWWNPFHEASWCFLCRRISTQCIGSGTGQEEGSW